MTITIQINLSTGKNYVQNKEDIITISDTPGCVSCRWDSEKNDLPERSAPAMASTTPRGAVGDSSAEQKVPAVGVVLFH